MFRCRTLAALTAALLFLPVSEAWGQRGGSSSRSSSGSGFSGGSSSRSSSGSGFSGGSSSRSGTSGGSSRSGLSSGSSRSGMGGGKPSGSGFSGGSSGGKPAAGTTGGNATGNRPSGSGFSGGKTNSAGNVVSNKPVADKTPISVSKKPAAPSFDKQAGDDAKKATSRANYERSEKPAETYKGRDGAEKKIDTKDKEVEYLRGRLDQQKWVDRNRRETSFYSTWQSQPVVVYHDYYHPMWNYWLMSQSLDVMSMWVYHHQASMDQARLTALYAQNAQLQAKVAALEAQKVARDPTWTPKGIDPDLMYDDGYVNAAVNPKPKVVEEYEYAPDGSSTATVLLWVFVYIPLGCLAALALFWLLFVFRW